VSELTSPDDLANTREEGTLLSQHTLPADPTSMGQGPKSDEWWRSAVVYQVYPRSFADSNGDGIGDLPGITAKLPYLRDLGIDAVWLSPFYPSPQADGGYDVADYRDVHPMFGTLADVERLIGTAHDLGLRVFIDIVPNHTSDEHPWFQQALAAGPGSPERARYWFVDSDGGHPNNWPSEFGGPAWTQVPDGQWYLHLFDRKQPDLNWENPEVRQMSLDTLRSGWTAASTGSGSMWPTTSSRPKGCRPSKATGTTTWPVSSRRAPRHSLTRTGSRRSTATGAPYWTATPVSARWLPRRG